MPVAYSDLEDGKRVSQAKITHFPLILLESIHNSTSLSPDTLKDLSSDFNPRAHSRLPELSAYQNKPVLLWSLLASLRADERGKGPTGEKQGVINATNDTLQQLQPLQTSF